MTELKQYIDTMTDAAMALAAAVSVHVQDSEEQRQMLSEINTLLEYGLHNLRTSIENLEKH